MTGVTHKLIEKNKEKKAQRPAWQPSQLSDVTSSSIRDIFKLRKDSPKLAALPEGASSYTEYPHSFGLPSERLIGRVVKGDVNDSGSFAVTPQEVHQWFQREWHDKVGVREKVEEVLSRRASPRQMGL